MKTCERKGCTSEFPARGRKRFCSDRCRFANHVGKDADPATAKPKKRRVFSELAKATRTELVKAGKLSTSHGQAALLLAKRIDDGGAESGAALAAMVREHAAAMGRAMEGGPESDPVKVREDEVSARRVAREKKATGR